ncbi:phosphoserine transaminase [Hyphomicrobium methylovorum]|uniref:phosphoserine transaminase n=1 Tax=Hyphomicrobium methylovorum TaxID=84 RepID=UPI0015E654E1|nr:phosphoserine transaminase [Hyphomicrobium methylovorum]MBA2127080.1 phosphoserine transaminase [Hyphomicrobium methylovorum]
MSNLEKPKNKPARPYFSCGPCVKRPGWTTDVFKTALAGRSHRSIEGRERLKRAITETHDILNLPEGYKVAIVAGSDTGAMELAMWNLLGGRGVDVLAWDVFGRIWIRDVIEELKLPDVRMMDAEPGYLPDLGKIDFARDVVFTWNGTTTGVRVPNNDWIPDDRQGLTICDATSALFAEDIDLSKIDVLTYSWQKALGGEAGHGMMIMSPRALERLATYQPPWPMPKLFRMKNNGAVIMDVFEGVTINTVSMLCVEDYLDALNWVREIGGVAGTIARSDASSRALYDWIAATPWVEPLAVEPATRTHTSIALRFVEPAVLALGPEKSDAMVRSMVRILAEEGAGFDLAAYRGMPLGLRIWCGPTVETEDIVRLTPWLEWSYAKARKEAGL